MTSLIKVPFASSGDKAVVPDTDAGGGVNMTQGYGQAYSLDPATDPSAKRIERDKMNWLFNLITKAINEIQSSGVATFITSADNGGSPFTYGKGALVSLGGVIYQSLVATNSTTPPGADWSALPEQIQPLDATLTALAALVGAANKLPYFSGADTAALTDLTQVGRDIIGKNAIADVLTYLDLTEALKAGNNLYEIAAKGAANQAAARGNLALNPISGIVGGDNLLPYFVDMNTAALAPFTAFARTLLSRSDASAVRTDLGLKNAAQRDVGTGATQIPDMSSFSSELSGNGKMRFPGGFFVQWGNANPVSGTATVHYNEAFVSTPWFIGTTTRQADFPTAMQSIVVNDSLSNNTQFSARTLAFDGTTFSAAPNAFFWFAIGRG